MENRKETNLREIKVEEKIIFGHCKLIDKLNYSVGEPKIIRYTHQLTQPLIKNNI